MPRQDVPYGGAICRLRERIAEIWDELGKKLHSINGVEGDGQGNVLIRSDSAALTITDDQLQHEIVLDLDTSQLPAADVNSVNNQVGVVVLTADDIPSDNGDVQTDLDNLTSADTTLQGNINAEALARQNADSTLQTNINNISAGLPAAAAAAVAADPTVAQLATDVPNKLDKITSGSSLKAYTHTGATQGEVSVVDGTTANSIGIRDANGRMQAADPASGATDKTLVTANWVSQSGDNSPNNLLHKNAVDETVAGIKTFYCSLGPWALIGSVSSRYKWYEIMTFAKGQTFQEVLLHIRSTRQTIIYECHIGIDTLSVSLDEIITTINTKLKAAYYDDGTDIHVYVYTPNYGYFVAEAICINGYRTWQAPKFSMTKGTATAQDDLPAGAVEVTIP